MKRTPGAGGGASAGGGVGSGGGASSQTKRAKYDDNEDSMTFEDELMMMEDMEMDGGVIDPGDLDGDDGKTEIKNWPRPHPDINSETDSIAFQWMDIDMTTALPLGTEPGRTDVQAMPVVRMYGCNKAGHSVLAYVHGFMPYFYVSIPTSVDPTADWLNKLQAALEIKMKEKSRGEDKKILQFVLHVRVVSGKQSLLGYHFSTTKSFLQVFVAMPTLVPGLKRIFDDGINVGSTGLMRGQTYESNVPYVLRFMIDNEISGSDWVECPAGSYSVRPPSKKLSHCSLEVDIAFDALVSHPSTGPWSAIAPLRILSFDIECQGRKGHFPEPQQDPVIQIASTVTLQGAEKPFIRNVFTLNTCLPIVGADVFPCRDEGELLTRWKDFVVQVDPDILTGYNIANFDLPYLLNRAKALESRHDVLKKFPQLGRLRGIKSSMKDTTFQSSAYGKRENIETTIHGRVIFDVLPYMFRNHKLSSYSLNSVSAEFLGQQKEDVHHSIISDLQMGSDADRRRLAVYCLKDAYLPQQLMNKLAILVNYIEMARVTGVPLNFLLTRGQQIKVFSMLLRKCLRENLLIPNIAKHGGGGPDEGYEGAFVIEPKKSFYQVPIATLDFASLYPSIMQAYNLCYSTLVSNEDLSRVAPEDCLRSPSGHVFVTSTCKKGILPQILDEILAARKRAKKDMAAATDPMEKAVQNGRQLALKISANSVYGFTGATVGQLPCVPIASSVTAYGRNLLLDTKAYVESTYTVANGFPANAEVVYGDTDSVMVNFGLPTVAEAMPLAERAAAEVSQIFPNPIKLEFEKVYFPYLLMNKKRYAGLLWTRPESYDKMDAKGLETVRRDNCLLVRRVVDTCLRKILIERDVSGAVEYAKSTIADLLQNKMDISMLVISKSLGKSADDADYSSKQAHVELAMRMKKRDPGSAPNVGDRVAYVIIQAAKGAPAYEKSEDPVYVLENNLPIDTEYYLTNQLSNPLLRIFEPIIPNAQSLLSGDHTRTVCKPTPVAKAGSIMMFAVKKDKCMGCKTLIADKDKVPGSPLCVNCSSKEGEIYLEKMRELNTHQQVFSQLWTECQRCQGSLHQDVICTNKDCTIFYKRKKVQMDLQTVQEAIDKFTW